MAPSRGIRSASWVRRTRWIGALIGALLLGPVSRATAVVWFVDGRALRVARVEAQGEQVRLLLEGGGEMALPAWRVRDWQRLQPKGDPGPADGKWREAAGPFAELLEAAARRHGLEPALLAAVVQVESAFDARAVSVRGAQGLMQLMPETARRFRVQDPFDARENLEAGAEYLSWLIERFPGRLDLALAGYNAGEGAVASHGRVPPFPETERYVRSVLERTRRLSGRKAAPWVGDDPGTPQTD